MEKEAEKRKPNKATIKVLNDALKGKNMSKPYSSMKKFWKSLDIKSK